MSDDSEGWRFTVAEVGDDGEHEQREDADVTDADSEATGGPAFLDERIEGGSIDLENALFVLLGAVAAVLILVRFVSVLA